MSRNKDDTVTIQFTIPRAVWKGIRLMGIAYSLGMKQVYEAAITHAVICRDFRDALNKISDMDSIDRMTLAVVDDIEKEL